ncbi:MAG: sensor histidine kinase [Minisyncoccales bacterium]
MNFFKEAKKYHIPFYSHPQFIFVLNGLIILLLDFIIFAILNNLFPEPEIPLISVFILTAVFLILSFLLYQVFSKNLEVNRLKTEFLSIFFHEIGRPLTVFDWTLDLFFSEKDEKEKEKYYQELKKVIFGMKNLLRDTVTLNRVEEVKKGDLRKEEIPLRKKVEEILNNFKTQLEKKKLRIELFIPENLTVFLPLEIFEILLKNLIENAVIYNKEGGEIFIEAKRKDKKFFFKIKDSGIGIPSDDQKFIFQKFFRAENAKKTEGIGLGLFICKEIIETLKGRINFESKEGKGTTFFFSLPLN